MKKNTMHTSIYINVGTTLIGAALMAYVSFKYIVPETKKLIEKIKKGNDKNK